MPTTVVDILVQPTQDPNVKVYHTRLELSCGPEVGARGQCEELGELGKLALEFPGVVQIHVCPYALIVTKAPLFSWGEVDPKMEEMLRTYVVSQRQIEDAYTNPEPITAND